MRTMGDWGNCGDKESLIVAKKVEMPAKDDCAADIHNLADNSKKVNLHKRFE